MTEEAKLKRHHRTLVFNADDALLLFYIMRLTPEGLTCGTCRSQSGIELLTQYASTLGDLDKPPLTLCESIENLPKDSKAFGDVIFDRMFFRDIFSSSKSIYDFALLAKVLFLGKENQKRDIAFSQEDGKEENSVLNKDTPPLLAEDAKIIISQRIPSSAQHISNLISEVLNDKEKKKIFAGEYSDESIEEIKIILKKMNEAEQNFFNDSSNPLFNWNEKDIEDTLKKEGFYVNLKEQTLEEVRTISEQEQERWFNSQNSAYGSYLQKNIGEESLKKIKAILSSISKKSTFLWRTKNIIATISFN